MHLLRTLAILPVLAVASRFGMFEPVAAQTASSSSDDPPERDHSPQALSIPIVAVPSPPEALPPPSSPPPALDEREMHRPATPRNNASTWVSEKDYPSIAPDPPEGTASIVLAIGAWGKPTGCRIARSTGSVRLDELSCALLMRRALFNPARDGQGRAIEGSYSARIRWRRPARPGGVILGQPGARVTRYTPTLDGDGRIIGCRVEFDNGGGLNLTGGEICELRFKPR